MSLFLPSARPKPKGLWKATAQSRRANNVGHTQNQLRFWTERQPNSTLSKKARGALALLFAQDTDLDSGSASTTDDGDELESISSNSSKRSHEEDDWDYPPAKRPRMRDMNTSSIAVPVQGEPQGCDIEDWEDLKDLFDTATERYENDEPKGAIAFIRAVIHDCHRFLMFYQDPSVVFTRPPSNPNDASPPSPARKRKQRPAELPTAFHAILGTALFLFGNLLSQDKSLVLENEPDDPTIYWLTALDVFETGESLPSRTSGLPMASGSTTPPPPFEGQEDWRMAIVWGRTLVCIADEMLARSIKHQGSSDDLFDMFADEPNFVQDSPLHTISTRRPPITRRMSFYGSTANDLMMLAMDQFSRGIFHMPHSFPSSSLTGIATTGASIGAVPVPPLRGTFSRPRELYTISSEVLLLSEKMQLASERQTWAHYADSVFSQMRMENPTHAGNDEDFTQLIDIAQGRCWLIIGSARAEELEDRLSDDGILEGEDAEDAREALEKAVEFLECAIASPSTVKETKEAKEDEEHLRPQLIESLLTLANLTPNLARREELYARAQREGANEMGIVLEGMDVDE